MPSCDLDCKHTPTQSKTSPQLTLSTKTVRLKLSDISKLQATREYRIMGNCSMIDKTHEANIETTGTFIR
jgi:hypothetical protein